MVLVVNGNNKFRQVTLICVLICSVFSVGNIATASGLSAAASLTVSTDKQGIQTFILHPDYTADLATLTVTDRKELDVLATRFQGKKITQMVISGHTDSSTIRDRSRSLYADNYILSRSRAQNVANYLAKILGIDAANISVSGHGPDKPIATNETREGRTRNRRVEIQVNAEAIQVVAPVVEKPAIAIDGTSLKETIERALATNPELLIQVNERLSRDQELEQARAGYLPTLDLTAGIGTERSRNPTTRARGEKYDTLTREEAALDARQMLFDGFATKSEVERQQARVSSVAYTVRGVAENTALDAAEVHLNLMRSERLLSLAEDNLESHKRTYDQIKLRSDAGVGRRADLEQIRGRLALAQSNVIAAQSVYEDALAVYVRIVGGAPAKDLLRPEKPTEALPASREEAVQQAMDSHPTLKSAMADVEATQAQHRASKHAFFPRFDLELSQSWNNDIDGQYGTNYDTQAMIRMRYNLLNGGGDSARKQQTAHLIDEAMEVRNRTYRQVKETMRLSWNSYVATEKQLEYLVQHVDASNRTRDAYQKQFNIGQRTLLDLLNAENELFQARQSYTNAMYDNLYAHYRILNAKGALLAYLGINVPAAAQQQASN